MSAKRFIPISESVLGLAAKLAERSGTPLRDFIESLLAEVLRGMQYRSDIIEVISLSDLLDDLRRVGGAALPAEVAYRLIDGLSDDVFNEVLSEVRKAASWYGTLVRVKRGSTVEALKLVLSVWLPDMNVSVLRGEGIVRVVASSNRQPKRVTELAAAVVEEMCRALGLDLKELVIEKGIVKAVIEEKAGEGVGE